MHTKNRLGHALALATQNGLACPRIPCYGFEWLYCCSALQFVPPAPEVLAEIKTTIFDNPVYPFILQLELSHNAI